MYILFFFSNILRFQTLRCVIVNPKNNLFTVLLRNSYFDSSDKNTQAYPLRVWNPETRWQLIFYNFLRKYRDHFLHTQIPRNIHIFFSSFSLLLNQARLWSQGEEVSTQCRSKYCCLFARVKCDVQMTVKREEIKRKTNRLLINHLDFLGFL